MCDLSVGDTVEISDCSLCVPDGDGYTDPKVRSEYISVICTDEKNVRVLDRDRTSLRNIFSHIRGRAESCLNYYIGGEEGNLASKLLLKSDSLSKTVVRDCRRAGISHVLCISGMHLSLLTGFCERMLLKLRAGKKKRIAVISLFLLFYIAVLGFPVSAVRSALTICSFYIGYIIGAGAGGLNSLCLTVIVMLAINPNTVADPGFILSVCATFGINTIGNTVNTAIRRRRERKDEINAVKDEASVLNGKRKRELLFGKIHDYFAGGIISWTAVNVMTALPVSLLFGEISLMAVPSGYIFPPLSMIIIVMSMLILLSSGVPFIPDMLGYYVGKFCRLFIAAAGKISSVRNVMMPLTGTAVKYLLVMMTVTVIVMLAVKLRKKWLIMLPPLYCMLLIFLINGICTMIDDDITVRVRSESSGDYISVKGGNTAVICDVSTGAAGPLKGMIGELKNEGVTEIQALILTHVHSKHSNEVKTAAAQSYIREVWLPYPVNAQDASAASSVVRTCEGLGIRCRIYDENEKLTLFGDTALICSLEQRIKRSDHPTGYIIFEKNGEKAFYLASSVWETELIPSVRSADPEYVIYGSHGPKPKLFSNYGLFGSKATFFTDEKMIYYSIDRDMDNFRRLCGGYVYAGKECKIRFSG